MFIDQYALSQDATMQKRIAVGMTVAATNVQGESAATYTAKQYAKRQQLARSIILDPTMARATKFAWLTVCGNAALTATSTDAEILQAIGNVWDDVAGVDASDLL